MRDYLELGPVPFGENCKQVGEPHYSAEGREEAIKYRDMLKTRFPQWAQFDCNFIVKTFRHDFGSYFEVVLGFESHNERSQGFASHVDNNLPEFWTDDAGQLLYNHEQTVAKLDTFIRLDIPGEAL